VHEAVLYRAASFFVADQSDKDTPGRAAMESCPWRMRQAQKKERYAWTSAHTVLSQAIVPIQNIGIAPVTLEEKMFAYSI